MVIVIFEEVISEGEAIIVQPVLLELLAEGKLVTMKFRKLNTVKWIFVVLDLWTVDNAENFNTRLDNVFMVVAEGMFLFTRELNLVLFFVDQWFNLNLPQICYQCFFYLVRCAS